MFNIVKKRDFMLGHNAQTRQEAEKERDNYGRDYVVVQVEVEDAGETRSAIEKLTTD